MNYHDSRGYPILPGDLLQTPHFIGSRRKRHYLYHVAVKRDDGMWAIPVQHLEPTLTKGGGEIWPGYFDEWSEGATIICGYPDTSDRKRVAQRSKAQ